MLLFGICPRLGCLINLVGVDYKKCTSNLSEPYFAIELEAGLTLVENIKLLIIDCCLSCLIQRDTCYCYIIRDIAILSTCLT